LHGQANLPAQLPTHFMSNINHHQRTRRAFIRDAAALAASISLSGCVNTPAGRSARPLGTNEKLNIGIIGAGGRGADNLDGVDTENILALCDVDENVAAKSFAKYPNAKRYRDFRKMLEAEKSLDAVVVSTPDHTHAIAAITAMQLGKHVYCEKPLAHSIYEARKMREVAARTGVVTQMGTQGHAMEGSRRAVEVIRSGAIGEVRDLHVWTDRPAGWWPQGEERPTDTPPVPDLLDWDLWLGPAPWRPYHPVYVPFKWRGRWDFGTGAIGDMGVHNLDTAFWALDLGLPTSAEVIDSGKKTADCPPLWSILRLNFPAKQNRGAVRLTFYDGAKNPPAELFQGEPIPTNGSLIIGSKGTLFTRTWHGGESPDDMFVLLPRKHFLGYSSPAPTLPRTKEHHFEFIQACKGGPKTESSFAYASVLTEALLVGQLALRTGKNIEWDAARMRAIGVPEGDKYVHPEFRKGWSI
jgi:predicted dehydrogenase